MHDGQGGLPDVVIKCLFKVDIIVLVRSKGVPDYVSNLEPSIDENNLDDLEHPLGQDEIWKSKSFT